MKWQHILSQQKQGTPIDPDVESQLMNDLDIARQQNLAELTKKKQAREAQARAKKKERADREAKIRADEARLKEELAEQKKVVIQKWFEDKKKEISFQKQRAAEMVAEVTAKKEAIAERERLRQEVLELERASRLEAETRRKLFSDMYRAGSGEHLQSRPDLFDEPAIKRPTSARSENSAPRSSRKAVYHIHHHHHVGDDSMTVAEKRRVEEASEQTVMAQQRKKEEYEAKKFLPNPVQDKLAMYGYSARMALIKQPRL